VQYSAVSLRGGGYCYFHIQGRKIEAVLAFCREIHFYPDTGRRRFLLHIGNFYQTIRGQITENGNSVTTTETQTSQTNEVPMSNFHYKLSLLQFPPIGQSA
jgi:hypothetical protein